MSKQDYYDSQLRMLNNWQDLEADARMGRILKTWCVVSTSVAIVSTAMLLFK